ncbi:hypothetical protein Dimus_038647 [Dionaea muscipula]
MVMAARGLKLLPAALFTRRITARSMESSLHEDPAAWRAPSRCLCCWPMSHHAHHLHCSLRWSSPKREMKPSVQELRRLLLAEGHRPLLAQDSCRCSRLVPLRCSSKASLLAGCRRAPLFAARRWRELTAR